MFIIDFGITMKKKCLISLSFLIIISIQLQACAFFNGASTESVQQTTIVPPSSTPTHIPSSTLTPSPSPSETPLPTNTSTPTPPYLVEAGTSVPTLLPPISIENAGQVSSITIWKEKNITDMTWSPDGSTLAISDGNIINLYEVGTYQKRRTLYPRSEHIINIEFSPNGTWLIAGSRRGDDTTGYASSLETWLGPDWEPRGLLYGSAQALTGMDFSPNGWYFATAYASTQESLNSVNIWNTLTWTISETLQTGTVLDVAFSSDGNMIACSPDRYAVKIWDLKEEQWVYTFHTSFTGAVTRFLFSPDSVTFAAGHYDGVIRLWDLREGEQVLQIESKEVIESIAFSPDGRILASGGSYENNHIRLWSAYSGELLNTLEGHQNGISHLVFSPDSASLVSGSYDGEIRIWGIRP